MSMPDATPRRSIDATWNPITGCTQVSAGCDHCYALAIAERSRGIAGHPYEQGFDLRLWPGRLEKPLHWKKPRMIFVNSMSDVFHAGVPDAFIRQIFDVMVRAHWHTYLILTKRPRRLARMAPSLPWPKNVWMGVSVESNEVAWRADELRRVPAAVRVISAEPLLGPLDQLDLDGIDWLITGGESGPRHRPCHPDWVRDIRDRCLEANVAFFHKQWGGRTFRSGGRELDGRTWEQMPVVAPAVSQLPLLPTG
ncbi:MAG TPA: phage Gp37/Gp68 family protein [Thermomicrobiales bacterium]|nr:phage Gp37/Gp68 family protein [Thermomicrobiales bacterium]